MTTASGTAVYGVTPSGAAVFLASADSEHVVAQSLNVVGGNWMVGMATDRVDTTGAGGGFLAGFLRGLKDPGALDGEPCLREVRRFANIVGALTTTERGAKPALPALARVAGFLARTEA